MNNIVDFGTGRERPRRSIQVAQDGARILFFTGVRYMRCADEDTSPEIAESERFCEISAPVSVDAMSAAARHAPA